MQAPMSQSPRASDDSSMMVDENLLYFENRVKPLIIQSKIGNLQKLSNLCL